MHDPVQLDPRYVEAALRAFARRGYFGTTMQNIADELGLTQARVSQVFDGKLSAFLAARRLALEVVLDVLRERPPPFDPAATMAALHELTERRPEVLMIVLHTFSAASAVEEIAELQRSLLVTVFRLLVDQLGATPEQATALIQQALLAVVLRAAHVSFENPAQPELAALLRLSGLDVSVPSDAEVRSTL